MEEYENKKKEKFYEYKINYNGKQSMYVKKKMELFPQMEKNKKKGIKKWQKMNDTLKRLNKGVEPGGCQRTTHLS